MMASTELEQWLESKGLGSLHTALVTQVDTASDLVDADLEDLIAYRGTSVITTWLMINTNGSGL